MDFQDEQVNGIRARTIHPDGTIINFEGKPTVKQVAKYKGYKYLAKTFALPDVQVGSVIEVRWTASWGGSSLVYGSAWSLNDELFTRQGKIFAETI